MWTARPFSWQVVLPFDQEMLIFIDPDFPFGNKDPIVYEEPKYCMAKKFASPQGTTVRAPQEFKVIKAGTSGDFNPRAEVSLDFIIDHIDEEETSKICMI